LLSIPLLVSVLHDRAVIVPAGLDPVAVHARGRAGEQATLTRLLAAVVVDVFDVEGMHVAWEVPKDREEDVDEEICSSV
jgi:hypothetical protein